MAAVTIRLGCVDAPKLKQNPWSRVRASGGQWRSDGTLADASLV
ncbi:MAG: hypothetical protein RMX65_017455 [Nostoc sp. DedQUE01]